MGRLNEKEMEAIISVGNLVIDATHPYAAEASQNLKSACKKAGGEYFRLLRPSENIKTENCIFVANITEAADFLNQTNGNVLITTGSKELSAFTGVHNYQTRLFPRVLPSISVLEICKELGFLSKNLIAMQGPFSKKLNAAILSEINAVYLVTKDTGKEGGFAEKIAAAKECGVTTIVIARPEQETGFSLEEIKKELKRRFKKQKEEPLSSTEKRFPLFLSLAGKKVLIVGGGQIAHRRAETLLSFGADIRLIAPKIDPFIQKLAQEKKLSVLQRTYQKGDVSEDLAIVIAATDSREVNRAIGISANEKRIPISVADSREESGFYFPAIIESEEIVGGIVSKNGSDHTLV
ncbi:MAG: precorrin-6A reductase, partial [Oscillospiraceae bacterium]